MPVSLFSMVLGLSGLGYALLNGGPLWQLPPLAGQAVLLLSQLVWAALALRYLWQWWRRPAIVRQQFEDRVSGSMGALVGISALVLVPGVLQYGYSAACVLAAFGISWHLAFSLWHAAIQWKGGRGDTDLLPSMYLPDVAGNFTSAAALGVLGQTDWAWLFLGAGVLSWLGTEPLVRQSIWQRPGQPAARRPVLGIQAAPAVVCGASLLRIDPHLAGPWVAMLLGYGLLQLLHGLALLPWLRQQRFAPSYWAYSFGLTSALNCCIKLAVGGNRAASMLALPLLLVVGAFIVYLLLRTLALPRWRAIVPASAAAPASAQR